MKSLKSTCTLTSSILPWEAISEKGIKVSPKGLNIKISSILLVIRKKLATVEIESFSLNDN